MSTSGMTDIPTNNGVLRGFGSARSIRTGNRWTTFTKLPVAFSGRQERRRGSGGRRESAHAPLERTPRVGVDVNLDRLPDHDVAELGLLEVRDDVNAFQWLNRHERLARLHVVARIDRLPVDEASHRARISV